MREARVTSRFEEQVVIGAKSPLKKDNREEKRINTFNSGGNGRWSVLNVGTVETNTNTNIGEPYNFNESKESNGSNETRNVFMNKGGQNRNNYPRKKFINYTSSGDALNTETKKIKEFELIDDQDEFPSLG